MANKVPMETMKRSLKVALTFRRFSKHSTPNLRKKANKTRRTKKKRSLQKKLRRITATHPRPKEK